MAHLQLKKLVWKWSDRCLMNKKGPRRNDNMERPDLCNGFIDLKRFQRFDSSDCDALQALTENGLRRK